MDLTRGCVGKSEKWRKISDVENLLRCLSLSLAIIHWWSLLCGGEYEGWFLCLVYIARCATLFASDPWGRGRGGNKNFRLQEACHA